MHLPGQLVGQRLMDGALAGEPGHPGEGIGDDDDTKVSLSAGPGARMPGVLA